MKCTKISWGTARTKEKSFGRIGTFKYCVARVIWRDMANTNDKEVLSLLKQLRAAQERRPQIYKNLDVYVTNISNRIIQVERDYLYAF
jgi:hypothetical protein